MTQAREPSTDRDIDRYTISYLKDYTFEAYMVKYRQMLVIERIKHYDPKLVLEVGCGLDLIYERLLRETEFNGEWIVVEPSSEFAQRARQRNPKLKVIGCCLEQAIGFIKEGLSNSPEFILCSGLLHEVRDPDNFLKSVLQLMDKDTVLHVNVPNSESFHRVLAKKMNLIKTTKELSKRNANLQQSRVYDISSLIAELQAANLNVIGSGGYFLKPFTHEQMAQLLSIVDDNVIEGLFHLGVDHPELASEIWADGRLREDG